MITVGVSLSGCSTTLALRPPTGVDLSGEWQLDTTLSDSPQQPLSAQDAVIGAQTAAQDAGGGAQGGGRGRGGRGGGGGMGGMPTGLVAGRPGMPEHRFVVPPHLSIIQTATALTLDITMPDGKHVTKSYTSGEKSVVTTTRGAADRTLGWDGDAYLIRTKVGDKGPQSDVRYALDNGGTLSMTATFTNSGMYDYQYTLTYDRVAP